LKTLVNLVINGKNHKLEIEPNETLLDVIRNRVGLTGTKKGCDTGDCGACTVLLNGKAVNSCMILAADVDGQEITTIEGLVGPNGELDPVQRAFVNNGAFQCGYCTPGLIMAGRALLNENPHPTEAEIRQGIGGNICRCTGYVTVVDAIMEAAEANK